MADCTCQPFKPDLDCETHPSRLRQLQAEQRGHDCNEHMAEVDGFGWDCTVCWPEMAEAR